MDAVSKQWPKQLAEGEQHCSIHSFFLCTCFCFGVLNSDGPAEWVPKQTKQKTQGKSVWMLFFIMNDLILVQPLQMLATRRKVYVINVVWCVKSTLIVWLIVVHKSCECNFKCIIIFIFIFFFIVSQNINIFDNYYY